MVNVQANTASATGQMNLVQDYLDALLRDVAVDAALYPEPELRTEPEPALLADDRPVGEPLAAPVADDVDTWQIADVAVNARGTRVRPDWASQPFAALLFEVDGMDMAAPLHELGGISLIGGKLQPVMGQAPWFMGLLRWNGRNIRVIDTARFLMPERVTDNQHCENYQSVIVLGDSLWALAVNQASQSVRLLPAEVRWREGSSSRPWLAGTLLDRLCSMLDVTELTHMLSASEQDRNQPVGNV